MSTFVYNAAVPDLPWATSEEEDERLRKIRRAVAIFFLAFAIAMPFLPSPEIDRDKEKEIPPALAKLILERKKQPKPVIVKKKVAKKKAATKKKPKPKPKKTLERARKKALSSGLLAFSSDLAALRNDSLTKKLNANTNLSRSKGKKSSRRSIITARADSTSSGINTSNLSRETGGGSLAGRSTTQVNSSIEEGGGGSLRSGRSGRASRPIEEIRLVFDQNKSAIYSLYNRALRKDPTLQGKIVLELTITPSGQVTSVRIISSELASKTLTRKLAARIKLFRFSKKDVDTVKVTYPIDFFPS
jgi:TonB family protein